MKAKQVLWGDDMAFLLLDNSGLEQDDIPGTSITQVCMDIGE